MVVVTGRSPDRRAQLLAAADIVVRAKGPAASMEDIAAEAGVSKPIVYRHFGDKRGLYRVLAERYVTELLGRLQTALAAHTDPRARLGATLETYLGFVEEHRQAYCFLLDPSAQAGSRAALSAFVRGIGEVVAGELASGAPEGPRADAARAWGHAIVGAVQLAGDWWLDTEPMPREDLAEVLCALLWSGLSAAPEVLGGRARTTAEGTDAS